MQALLAGTLDPTKYTEEQLPPIIPFFAKSVSDDVVNLYQCELDTQLQQMNSLEIHQKYRVPYNLTAAAMLYKALAEGDNALHTTLGPILPHMSFGQGGAHHTCPNPHHRSDQRPYSTHY